MYVPRNRKEALFPRSGLPMIFVHTPKCAGSFVAAAFGHRFRRCVTLREPSLAGHQTWQEYRRGLEALGLSIADYVTFSTMRNPWAWHASWYSYIRGDRDGKRSGHRIEHELFQKMNFRDYILSLDDPDVPRGPQGYITRQISEWFTDADGRIAVDHVLLVERIEEDFERMRAAENLRVTLPGKRVNTSREGDFREAYDSVTEEAIRKRHARDIAMFGYDFATGAPRPI